MYRTVVIQYTPKAKQMARRIEKEANRMEQEGFSLVSCAVTPSAKGILVFRRAPDALAAKEEEAAGEGLDAEEKEEDENESEDGEDEEDEEDEDGEGGE